MNIYVGGLQLFLAAAFAFLAYLVADNLMGVLVYSVIALYFFITAFERKK